ncbi:hypothetical protein CIG2463D_1090 [Campylobacter iguaniorum]|uniref:Uncharacterized protein n=1 Tax=Campylobacter iguaniorum TaxID=1244531 RepID=A0A076FBT5_9BACT|nr:hypothetical protein [Campylobacter iguaniorum]AII14872.1 hypothetical protein CIG1485E_1036 [Campylobacter iguaniorum]ALV24662.1 hypothetical protein CIG2463D_1090 [Campylobacter iguaniorum]
MTYDELEVEAMVQEALEECVEFENLDDEELFELIENVKNLTGSDAEEAYEYLSQYSPISRKRFVALYYV